MNKLTERKYWDTYWERYPLPAEIKRGERSFYLNEILDVFDKYFPVDSTKSVLEIGGSPGQYLAYVYKRFGYQINCLDYSEVGCRKTEENFSLLKIDCNIVKVDLFADNDNPSKYDIVYSLGFVEHFDDSVSVIEKHMKFLKKDGLLLIGMPNFLGINSLFLKVLAPELIKQHNLKIMNIDSWKSIEEKLNLKPLFKGYIGGFEPSIFNRWEKKTVVTFVFKTIAKILSLSFTNNFKSIRKYNSRYISGYVIGVFKT